MYRIGQEELEAVRRVIESRELFRVNTGNREVEHFEREWAKTCGSSFSLCVSGGTGALAAALVGVGVGPGDEVIVPGYTFMATATAVLMTGAIPVICEIDASLCLDPVDFENKISEHVKAVIPVHMVGLPCDMDPIMHIAKKHGIFVVEDACQAVGGAYKNRRLGAIGDAGAYSFNFYKNISAGEGGAVVTNDRRTYERALLYHDAGATFRPFISTIQEKPFIGNQLRVSEITGAILRVQLERMDDILNALRTRKRKLNTLLSGQKGVTLAKVHDEKGDCGTHLALSFATEAQARAAGKDMGGSLPIDSGRHVYSNWDPILDQMGAHHPHCNPYHFEANRALRTSYRRDMCPNTLDVLKKSVLIGIQIDWTDAQIEQKAAQIVKACNTTL